MVSNRTVVTAPDFGISAPCRESLDRSYSGFWDDKDQPEPGDIPQNERDVTLAEADFQFQTSHSVDGYPIAHRDHRLLHGLSAQIPLESFLRLQRPADFLFRISIGV